MMKVLLARPFPVFVSGNPAPQIFLKKLNPAINKEFQNGMSCYHCLKELDFHEIAGFNPNLAAEDANRTNFCWENDTGTWKAAPVCDDCYWDQADEDDTDTDVEEEGEEEPLPVYSFCKICTNVITEISTHSLTDEELEIEMFSHICDDCIENPSTPPITLQLRNALPSAEQERSPSPSSWSSWSQP